MPSDKLRTRVLQAIRPARDRFRSALATTIEELRSYLAGREQSPAQHVASERVALGSFTAGRVDPQRFTALLAHGLSLDTSAAERIESAFKTLQGLEEGLEALGVVTVERGGSLRRAVDTALAEIGRAYGAAHVVAAARAGAYEEERHAALLRAFPFRRWSPAERGLAPPLFFEVHGRDLHAGGLAEFLDGDLKIVLRVEGPCSPAPLARLITPRTFVVQTDDPDALADWAAYAGPGVAALVPEGAAHFVHDPRAGDAPAERLVVTSAPAEASRRPVGGISADQQADELDLLRSLLQAKAAPLGVGGGSTTDKLAAWLLSQADLKDLS